ncbi:MAG: hypothetical protein WA063_04405 [Minisyncoccia bacterium]
MNSCNGNNIECPNSNYSLNETHIIFISEYLTGDNDINGEKVCRFLNNISGGLIKLNEKKIKKLLSVIVSLHKCNCGLVFGITNAGEAKRIIKIQMQ